MNLCYSLILCEYLKEPCRILLPCFQTIRALHIVDDIPPLPL